MTEPFKRPFSLLDLDIAFPYIPESISAVDAVWIVAIAPTVIIGVVVLIFVPGPAFVRANNKSQIFRLKLWELERGVAGLAMSIALTFFIVQGMKNLFGKPRPNLLARCQPDLDNIASHVVGGFGKDISARWTLVTDSICTQTDRVILDDGFRSFPSGHSSFSWAGLLYLTLFLCSKFAIAMPFLQDHSQSSIAGIAATGQELDCHALLPLHNDSHHLHNERTSVEEAHNPPAASDIVPLTICTNSLPLRNRAAAPPNHLLVLALVPVAVAVYICSTRYSEFYHFGFDIISGSSIGVATSWFSFRWYHLPIRQGAGWAWGARSRERAFGVGVGTRTYVGSEGWDPAKRSQKHDEEAGRA